MQDMEYQKATNAHLATWEGFKKMAAMAVISSTIVLLAMFFTLTP